MSKTIYKDPTRFYVYAFLREDGTPYYIGKCTGNRAWVKRRFRPSDDSRIALLKETLTESEAFTEEIRLIQLHGRKDLGTGYLRNMTDGGEGASGYKATPEHRAKQSAATTGKTNPNYGKTGEKSPSFGKKHTAETRAKMSVARIGKCQSPETIANKSGEKNPNYGKVPSEETKAKRLATRKRNKEEKALAETNLEDLSLFSNILV